MLSPCLIIISVSYTHLDVYKRQAVHSPLVRDENGIWRMDYADMEKQLREKKIHAAILCNPHNPCGRVWERRELEKAMELYRKYDVYVISDEIWSDLILNGHKHIPSQSVSEDARQRTAAFYAPSKTFNLAGLVGSYHIVYNSWWRDRILKESSLCLLYTSSSQQILPLAAPSPPAQLLPPVQSIFYFSCRYSFTDFFC